MTIPNKTALKQFVETIFKKEKHPLQEIRYIFCSDDYLLQINRDHLQHDYYTDIITFDLSEGNGTIGEVYISLDRVKDNAKTHETTYPTEARRVIFHGALHLCGYKDKSKADAVNMRKMEDLYLKKYLVFLDKQ
ncbi:rRNA maturation RNase YbeY [Deminuibacter soli]|uniref:Endoribonuclease YbeY n=1 Tax=Deminuibacter soli TaxID=2291815 RepID=A0A3E1NSB1_9BACT|nr:rRNA maturation RNase YbeY [Deminuibacter soli]